MEWIERLFNVRPDNGDGTLEALIIIAAALVALALVPAVRRRLVEAVAAAARRVREATDEAMSSGRRPSA